MPARSSRTAPDPARPRAAAQAAYAGEIAELAAEMRSLLRVVVGERHRLRSSHHH